MSKTLSRSSPSKRSSAEPGSPISLTSLRTWGRRRGSSAVEPFPALESEGTASTAESSFIPSGIPRTTLLTPSKPPRDSGNEAPTSPGGDQPKGQDEQKQKQQKEQKQKQQRQQSQQQQQSQSDRTDALWAEMQATLADVELSASKGTHFFGSKHSAALEELRTAQMALADAWSHGEGRGPGGATATGAGTSSSRQKDDDKDYDDEIDSREQSPGTSVKNGNVPDTDVEAAIRRREANDRYFTRIQQGVTNVVDKLEGVALAMGKVERESRDIWSSESGLDSSDPGS